MANNLTVMLVGRTGSGKSLLANSLFEVSTHRKQSSFEFTVGGGTSRETDTPQIHTGEHDGFTLSLVDTPGLFDKTEEFEDRWFDLLMAVELTRENGIDAIVLVVHVEQIAHGAACLKLLQSSIGGHVLRRMVIVFTHCGDPKVQECDQFLDEFNSKLESGVLGIAYVFSDQKIRNHDKKKGNLMEILQHLRKIKENDSVPIKKDNFSRYTKELLFGMLLSETKQNLTYDDVCNLQRVNVRLMESFLKKSTVSEVIIQRNGKIRADEESKQSKLEREKRAKEQEKASRREEERKRQREKREQEQIIRDDERRKVNQEWEEKKKESESLCTIL